MKFLALLPPFIPLDEVKSMTAQILPELEIQTEIEGERPDVEVLVATTFTRLGRNDLMKFPNLKYLQIASTGYDNVDLGYIKEKGIMLCNIPTANKQSVAEHVIMFILIFLKDTLELNFELKHNHNWPLLTGSRDLEGKTVGIVGMGMIGRQLALRLLPFNVTMVYYDVNRLSEEDEDRLGVTYLEFDELLKISDIITLHLPLTENTREMFKDREFSLMKDGAIFINTSRGEIVDEKALIKAVKEKGIRAGIDVFSTEPPDFSSELFSLDNVIVTPHMAGVTMESQQRFIAETISNVLRYAQGIDPLYKVQL